MFKQQQVACRLALQNYNINIIRFLRNKRNKKMSLNMGIKQWEEKNLIFF